MSALTQDKYAVRMDWGRSGLEQLASAVEVVVIVDVLSFSTAVEVAVSQGARVYPSRMKAGLGRRLAERVSATLAVGRRQTDADHPYSLSPQSLSELKAGTRLVLPSPNGATLSQIAADQCERVLCGCLRNAHAAAAKAQQLGATVAVIAAGELWPTSDDPIEAKEAITALRPTFEDLVGAGAILSQFPRASLSPEAWSAVAVFDAARSSLTSLLKGCASGRELTELGFEHDVIIASQLNISKVVPRLVDGSFEEG